MMKRLTEASEYLFQFLAMLETVKRASNSNRGESAKHEDYLFKCLNDVSKFKKRQCWYLLKCNKWPAVHH